MAQRKWSRPVLIALAVLVVTGGLGAAFWPKPVMVDLGQVVRGEMTVTIDEEGRTRVREAYIVSTPVEGRLMRVHGHPGDPVTRNATVVAQMRPTNPAALDVRTREQARAAVEAARAALQVAEADLEAAKADLDLAESDLARTSELAERGTTTQAALDRARSTARAAQAHRGTAEAAIAQRKAELASAQAQLIGFDDRGLVAALESQLGDEIPIYAPADGRILRVIHENESTVAAGTPIMEIGDIENDLEVVTELMSSDAVQVSKGNGVIIENWGGPEALSGTVDLIEPRGVTKTSTLGVEEQRVNVVIRLDSPVDQRPGLGDGFRVETRILIWHDDDALTVPSSALLRVDGGWAVFRVSGRLAVLQRIAVGRDNGSLAEVLDGLEEGETVVLYPPPGLSDGDAVERRVAG